MKYQPIHVPENLIEAINETNSSNNKIQVYHFDNDHSTVQDDHSNNNEDDGKLHTMIRIILKMKVMVD